MMSPMPELCYCPKCCDFVPHRRAAQYTAMGELRQIDDTCLRCGEKNRSHEAPLADAPYTIVRGLEAQYWRYAKWRIEQKLLNDDDKGCR